MEEHTKAYINIVLSLFAKITLKPTGKAFFISTLIKKSTNRIMKMAVMV